MHRGGTNVEPDSSAIALLCESHTKKRLGNDLSKAGWSWAAFQAWILAVEVFRIAFWAA